MIKLINTRLVAKLMRETAKECGMTRLYSSTDNVWWARGKELREQGAINIGTNYRRIVKAYDFIADNFIELLEAKVKAEGFDLADNKVTLRHRGEFRDFSDPEYKKAMRYYFDNWDEERAKGNSISDIKAPMIPNTENSVYVRLVASFKNDLYGMWAFNSDLKEAIGIGHGKGLDSLEGLVNYYIESKYYPKVTKDCEFGVERLQTGEQFSFLFREKGHTYDTNYYLEATEWEEVSS